MPLWVPGAAPVAAEVLTSEGTASGTYTDLATAGPSVAVTVRGSGFVIVSIHASLIVSVAGFAFMGWVMSGANTMAAQDRYAVGLNTTVGARIGGTWAVGGLVPGATTIKMVYKTSAGTSTFQDRELWALAP